MSVKRKFYCQKCGGVLLNVPVFSHYSGDSGEPLYHIKSTCPKRRTFLDGHTGGWVSFSGGVSWKEWRGLFTKGGKLI